MHILIISGTNRSGNLSIGLANTYFKGFQKMGLQTKLLNLESLPQDLVHSDLYGKRSAEFLPIQELVLKSKCCLFVVPEYNGSIPGILKLFIDACDYPESFTGKEAWLVGLSAGNEGNHAGLKHLTDILHFLGGRVHNPFLCIGNIREKVGIGHEISDPETKGRIQEQINQISSWLSGNEAD